VDKDPAMAAAGNGVAISETDRARRLSTLREQVAPDSGAGEVAFLSMAQFAVGRGPE
jgi:hypothetical protein